MHTAADCSKEKDSVHFIQARVVLYSYDIALAGQQVSKSMIKNSCPLTHTSSGHKDYRGVKVAFSTSQT